MPRPPAYRPKCRACHRSRRSDQLLCPRCWDRVPANLQDAVMDTWKRGSLRQSEEYCAAVEAAIEAAKESTL